MRRSALLWASSVIVACSSNPSPDTGPREQVVRIGVQSSAIGPGSAGLRIVPSGGPNILTVDAPLDAVWRVLPAAYDSLGLQLGLHDPTNHVLGNEGFKIRRRLGKTPLSKYLECGKSQMEPNADEYEITMSVVTRATPVDSLKTKLTTSVQASAKGLQFSGQYAQCSSKGALETRLQEILASLLFEG